MNKDAYYFPHFSNARTDRKLRRVRKELGIEGYGIYYMILEVLREQEDFSYPLSDVDLLADDFGTSEQKIQTVISKYGLFKLTEDDCFFSEKLIEYLKPYLERSKRARKAALKRWESVNNANALPEHSVSNASKVKESKVKKIKEKDSKVDYLQPPLDHFPNEKTFVEYGIMALRYKESFLKDIYNSKLGTAQDGYFVNGTGNKITNWQHWMKSLKQANDNYKDEIKGDIF